MNRSKERKIIDKPVDNSLLNEITRRIVAKVKPEKVILFGSFAYGKPQKDSDLDLFIIKNTSLPTSKRYALISSALYPRLIPMDFIVRTPKEVKKRLQLSDPFIKEILENGRTLYERSKQINSFCG